MGHSPRRGFIDTVMFRRRRGADRNRNTRLRPLIESLETRTVLSTIMWNTTVAPTGGNWDAGNNWVGGVAPGASDDAVIDLTSAGIVTLSSNQGDAVHSLTTNSTTSFVDSGTLTIGAGSSTLGGPVTVSLSSTLTIGAGASVVVGGGQTITDNGTLNVAANAVVALAAANNSTTEIAVNGTLNATRAAIFDIITRQLAAHQRARHQDPGQSRRYHHPHRHSTFSLPLFVPYNDVATLAAGSNQSFHQIEIDAGTQSSGTVNLNPIGTSTTNLSYVFPADFTIGAGATLTIGTGVTVVIAAGQTITDNGTLNVGASSTVALTQGNNSTTEIAVNGTLNATSAIFDITGSAINAPVTIIQVNPGGIITPTGSTFSLPLFVPYNDVSTLAAGNNQSFDQIEIDAGTLSSGTVNLNQIGTSTTNLSYVFPAGFTIGAGATLTIGTGVSVVDRSRADNHRQRHVANVGRHRHRGRWLRRTRRPPRSRSTARSMPPAPRSTSQAAPPTRPSPSSRSIPAGSSPPPAAPSTSPSSSRTTTWQHWPPAAIRALTRSRSTPEPNPAAPSRSTRSAPTRRT